MKKMNGNDGDRRSIVAPALDAASPRRASIVLARICAGDGETRRGVGSVSRAHDAAMPMRTRAMPMAKYFAAVKRNPIITAKVLMAVPPNQKATKPARKKARMPSFVSLSPPGSFSVATLNTLSAMGDAVPLDARGATEAPRANGRPARGATPPHAKAAAVSAPRDTSAPRGDAPVDAVPARALAVATARLPRPATAEGRAHPSPRDRANVAETRAVDAVGPARVIVALIVDVERMCSAARNARGTAECFAATPPGAVESDARDPPAWRTTATPTHFLSAIQYSASKIF